MIRINLLPIKQDRRREAGRNQIAIAVGILIVQIVILVFVNMNAASKVDEQKNKNSIVKANVERIKRQIKDHQQILNEIKKFEKRQAAIESLEDARTGPVHVMLELSNIMSKDGKPSIDNDRYQEMTRIDPASGYDENWDFRRLWISRFGEKDRKVKISGQGVTHEDVAEFLRRINLSDFFVASELVSTSLSKPKFVLKGVAAKDIEPVVHFKISGTVRYR